MLLGLLFRREYFVEVIVRIVSLFGEQVAAFALLEIVFRPLAVGICSQVVFNERVDGSAFANALDRVAAGRAVALLLDPVGKAASAEVVHAGSYR